MTVSILQVGTLNNKHHSMAGFTLFELLIVLAIMGMMMSMLVFNINFGSTSDDMKTAIRRISGAVSEARSRALLKRTPLELRVSGNTLELYQTIQNNRHRLGSAQLPANVIIEDIEIDGKHGRHVLLFQSRGITQPAIIRLASGDERQKILVRPILGIKLIDGKKTCKQIEPSEITHMISPFFSLLAACILLSGCATTDTKSTAQVTGSTAQIATQFHKEGNITEALQYYAEAIEEHETPQLHNGAGTALLEAGSPQKALAEFNRALILMPASAELHTNKGTAEILLGDEDSAEESFDKALTYAPDNPAALNGKAFIMLHKKEYESALILLVKAAKLAPDDRAVMFNKALSFEGTDLLEDADNTLTLLLEENPKDAEVRNARGIVRMKRKRYDLARDDFTFAIALSPTTGIFYYNKAILQQHLMDYKKAVANYTRAIAYDPINSAAYINRGESYFLLGKKLKGCNDLKKACEMGLCKKLESYESARLCKKD